jgi:hypothetical protein
LIAIQQDEDWNQLRSQLDVVVDRTIFRTAEVFLQGGQAAQDKSALWQAISANIGSLAAFIDAIVLNKRLPIFDYLSTFPDRHENDRAADDRLVDFRRSPRSARRRGAVPPTRTAARRGA